MQSVFCFQNILVNQGFTVCDLEIIKNVKANSTV